MTNSILSHYSDTITDFNLLSNLPPINIKISTFDDVTLTKFNALISSNSTIKPIINNGVVSRYEINKKALKQNINTSKAKKVYRNIHLRKSLSIEEKATLIVINLSFLMLIVMSSDSILLLNLIKSEVLLNIILASSYLISSFGMAAYYLSICYLVFNNDVVNDIISGIIQANHQPIIFKI